MPYLPDQVVRITAGQNGLTIILAEVQDAPIGYFYTYSVEGSITWPGTLALGTGVTDTNVLRGNAPADAGYRNVRLRADNRGGVGSADPAAPYFAQVEVVTLPAAPLPPTLEERLQGILEEGSAAAQQAVADGQLPALWRTSDRYRIGLQHSDQNDQYIFMSLPRWAHAGSGIVIPEGALTRQWLPIENIQEAILPRIKSNEIRTVIFPGEGDYVGPDFIPPGETARPANMRASVAYGQNRTNIRYGPARLRLLWNADYATHGGPYGLEQAAMDMDTFPRFVHYSRSRTPGIAGKAHATWTGFVSELTHRITRRGFITDVVIQSVSGLTSYPGPVINADLRTVGSIIVPQLGA